MAKAVRRKVYKLDEEQLEVAGDLPNPLVVLWNVLIDKGVVTEKELYDMSYELSGLSKEEFETKMEILRRD